MNIFSFFSRKTHDLLFTLQMSVDYFFYNETKQKPYHYIPNIIQYYITLNLMDDIHLQLGFHDIRLTTKSTTHQSWIPWQNLSSLVVSSPKPLPWYTSPTSHWSSSHIDLLSCILIGPWDLQFIINLPLLNLSYSCMLCNNKITQYID